MSENGEPESMRALIDRLGWWFHLLILSAFPVALGLLGHWMSQETQQSILPGTVEGLVYAALGELGLFAVVIGLAWIASRASLEEMRIYLRSWWAPVYGLGYSVALRITIFALSMVVAGVVFVVTGGDLSAVKSMTPQVQRLIDLEAISGNPVYFWLTVTVISFVVAGLREELWRSGMFAALEELFPELFEGRSGMYLLAALPALLFGFGHLTQGWGGVAYTFVLGLVLGLIMLYHDSIWEAVLAHGFFNATSFLAIRLLGDKLPLG